MARETEEQGKVAVGGLFVCDPTADRPSRQAVHQRSHCLSVYGETHDEIEFCQRVIDYLRMEHHVTGRQMTTAEEKELGIDKLEDEIKKAVEQQGNCIKMVAERVKGG